MTFLRLTRRVASIAAGLALMAALALPCLAAESLRVATFNLSLYGQRKGEILERLNKGDDFQAKCLAEIIQRAHPDLMLLNEIDYDPQGAVVAAFCDKYLAIPHEISGAPTEPLKFPYRYTASVNTGAHSGFDLNRDGVLETAPDNDQYAADCWGYGRYHGQYGMAILSKFPIDAGGVRTFQNFLWKDMPGARLPDDAATDAPADYFPAEAVAKFPLSSKSHWDVPIIVGQRRIHLLTSHPTPPVYDGPEDRNGRRNHDEIRFWVDYTGPPESSSYIYDDKGGRGGLTDQSSSDPQPPASSPQSSFIIMGDLNGDPHDGDGKEGIAKLLASPAVLNYPAPASEGGVEQAKRTAGANLRQSGDPANDTCDPADNPGPGNLRLDYLLPSRHMRVASSGVFWPRADEPAFKLVGVHPFPSSDHRLVWIDLELPSAEPAAADQPEPEGSKARK